VYKLPHIVAVRRHWSNTVETLADHRMSRLNVISFWDAFSTGLHYMADTKKVSTQIISKMIEQDRISAVTA
jgi:hypothetical protein